MGNSKIKRLVRHSMPIIIALLSFAVLMTGAISYSNYKKDKWEKDVKVRLFEILMTKKTKLERALYSRIHYTRSVSAYVSLKPELLNSEFYNLAEELINKDSVISTMALSRNCIIDAIYPIKGHEAAIGLNLLAHPERKEIVEQTIESHKTFIAGPVELVEGGIAFISYTPIFDKTNQLADQFWGVTDIVIYRDKILQESTLNESEFGFLFALRGYNGLGDNGDVWWGDKKIFENNPVRVNIELPYGNWVLAAIPEIGWSSYLNQDNILLILLIASSCIISILIWILSRAIVKIRRNEQELKAIFHSMDSLIIEFNHEGRYMKIPPVNENLLIKPKEELLRRTLYESLDEETAVMIHQAIKECLKHKKLIQVEYPLQVGSMNLWFLARISWKSEQRVIFHAFDITEQKSDRKKILDSEKRLQELNSTKDMFFSIIAHDLKSPFNSIIGFANLLLENFQNYNQKEIQTMLQSISESSQNTFGLLENLLSWASSQTGLIDFKSEQINLQNLVIENIYLLQSLAIKKNIEISSEIQEANFVFGDKNMINTILRNLISNAIKFTPPNGKIFIATHMTDKQCEISVRDTGVGIAKKNIQELFKIDSKYKSEGTANEKGTGLGLILCKEFIEKHDGKIWVESEEGKGSIFYFTIPKNTKPIGSFDGRD